MTGFFLFGSILVLLIATIVWAAIRAGDDTGTALAPAERRDAAIEALRDLELEFRTGKLDEKEYEAVREHLEREALDARDRVRASSVTGARSPADPPGPRPGSEASPNAPSYCTACGAKLDGDEAYCPSCGALV